MHCTFCNKNNFAEIYKTNSWSILRCKHCSLVSTSVNQTVSYANYHRDTEYHNEETIFKYIFLKRYHLISRYVKKVGKVLDIGASTGTMLDIFKEHGWETYGVEPSESYKVSQSKGHTILHADFEGARLQKEFFDLVIINHTLEHVENPSEVLSKIQTILKPDGIVYIDVPNFDSVSRKLAGSKWKYLLPFEHVHHFEPLTLKAHLTQSKLKIKSIKTWSGIFDVSSPVALLLYKLTHFKKSFFTDIIGIPGNIVATFLNQGTNLVIIAKK